MSMVLSGWSNANFIACAPRTGPTHRKNRSSDGWAKIGFINGQLVFDILVCYDEYCYRALSVTPSKMAGACHGIARWC